MGDPVAVAILDRDDLSRNGIAAIVAKAAPDMRVQAILTSRQELETAFRTLHIDVLLVHDSFPHAAETPLLLDNIRLRSPGTAAIILSQKLLMGYIQQMLSAGAKGYIYNGEALEALLPLAIRTVLRGDIYLSPSVSLLPYRGELVSADNALNARDLHVLQLLHDGFPVMEIAAQLQVDRKTVYRARDRLRLALGVRTNEQIVPSAYARGLL